jgi:hypothetical protein
VHFVRFIVVIGMRRTNALVISIVSGVSPG